MKKIQVIFVLAIFVGAVFFACSSKGETENIIEPGFDSSSSSSEPDGTCDAGPCSSSDGSSSSAPTDTSSSSQGESSSTSSSSYSSSIPQSSSGVSSSSRPSSSSAVSTPGANCAYKPSWCNNMTFNDIVTGPFNGTAHSNAASINNGWIGGDNDPPEHQHCLFVTGISNLGNHNQSGNLLVNGIRISQDGRCGKSEWNQPTCANALSTANVQKADGGYYIYVEKWAGEVTTTGGTPVCSGNGGGNNTSSSSSTPSSSSATTGVGIAGNCIAPPGQVSPPSGKGTCIKVGDKCYICNPDRGNECLQTWLWDGNQVKEEWWFTQVSCDEAPSTSTLTCTGLVASGIAGTAISQPTIKCDNSTLTSGITWTNAPAWASPAAATYNISAAASCGGSNKTASCGTLIVSAAPSTDQLTCTGMPTTGVAGTAITPPTVRCGNAAATSITWTNAPTWTSPAAATYNVSAAASCGGSNKTASCGTLKVSPKLTCGNLATTSVIAGTAVTPPTVTCENSNVSSITWTGAPSVWSAPTQGTYSNIQATATTGDCSGQTATCSGTLTVNPKLTCGSVTQTVTTTQAPTKPQLTCGSTAVTSNITWTPNINNALAAGTHTVSAMASCGGSNQTATCSGTITVTTATTPSSSSVPSSSSASGGTVTKPPFKGGTSNGVTTRYWDACKPSCGWSANAQAGGVSACRSCSVTGGSAGNDVQSACQGGSAYTCMSQAPWQVSSDLSYGFAATNASNNGNAKCGKCYRLDFSGSLSGKSMVVKVSNIGGDVNDNHFDIMIPGGGVGQFNALSTQVQQSGATANLGQTYGGFRATCGANASCIKDMCDSNFKNLPELKAGCYWYVDWYNMADNPNVTFGEVDCPAALNSKW